MDDAVSQRALDAARARVDELIPLLTRWVEINSFSANVAGVNRMGDLLAADFAHPALTLERRPGQGVGDHLVWRTPAFAAHPERRLLLIGHHDTVFPPGSFEAWDLDGDRLRGPGVLDMKGGLLTIRTALFALGDAGLLADIPVAVISVGDEEIGSPDSRSLTEELARGARAALVFEAGRAGDAIITRRKGTGAITVVAEGVAAHAGNHHQDGVNAIWVLARFIDAVQQLTDYDLGVTVNVGTIQGGEARNTVPHTATCGIDLRFVRVQDGERAVAEMHRLADEIGTAMRATLRLEGGIRRPALERTEASAALCQRYAACARAACLGDGEADLIGGGSDASTVSALGVPAIDGLGPRGKGFHTSSEYIEVSSLPLRIDALVRFLAGWRG